MKIYLYSIYIYIACTLAPVYSLIHSKEMQEHDNSLFIEKLKHFSHTLKHEMTDILEDVKEKLSSESHTLANKNLEKNPTKIHKTMKVFVHGTIKPPHFSIPSVLQIMKDKPDGTLYSEAIKVLRQDDFFYYGQPIQSIGLHSVNPLDPNKENRTAQVIASLYNMQYKILENDSSPDYLYYTFGWSGLLSKRKRYEAAEQLYNELQKEIERLKKLGMEVTLELVTYSHGGNVALYLPLVEGNLSTSSTPSLIINQLTMLACPIQPSTDYLVAEPMFKKVYNIFSSEDFVQQWDFFTNQEQFFSGRMLQDRKNFKVPNKVTQIRIRCTKNIIGISRQALKKDHSRLLMLPERFLDHRDPGHMEMGGFAWGNYWYREAFPLYPLSILAIVPTIVSNVKSKFGHSNLLTFDIINELNCALLTDRQRKKKKIVTLWTPELKKEMWNFTEKNIPKNYTFDQIEEHIARALQTARQHLLKIRKYRKPHSKTLARYLRKADQLQETGSSSLIEHAVHKMHRHHRIFSNLYV